MRKYLMDVARNRLKTMGASNKAMKKLWRDVLFGELAAKGHENQMKMGRNFRREQQARKALKARKIRRIEA